MKRTSLLFLDRIKSSGDEASSYRRVMIDVGEFPIFHHNCAPRDDLKRKMVDYISCFFVSLVKVLLSVHQLLVD